jgi:hypothetical protein
VLHGVEGSEKLKLSPSTAQVVGEMLSAAVPEGQPVASRDVQVPPALWRRLSRLGLVVV